MAALFFVDVRMSAGAYVWSNNWLLEAADLLTADLNAFDFAEFHQHMLANFCQVQKVITSQIPDPTKTNFIEHVVGLPGLLTIAPNQAPAMWTVMWCDLATAQGKPGRKFLRAAFDKAFMNVPDDRPVFTNFAAQQAQVGGAFGTLFNAINAAGNTLMMSRKHTRPVVSLGLRGIAIDPTNHKYFDKAGPK